MEAEKFNLETVEEYLEAEKTRDPKHEYLAGTVHAMSRASRRHNVIALSTANLLRERLRKGRCETYLADVKICVRTKAGVFFYYPDVMVGCDPTDRHEYYLDRPLILFEVTSASTESTDRREKLLAYQGIASLRHYGIVSQTKRAVEWFRRAGDGWEKVRLTGPDDALDFPEIGVSLRLEEIYEGIEFEEAGR